MVHLLRNLHLHCFKQKKNRTINKWKRHFLSHPHFFLLFVVAPHFLKHSLNSPVSLKNSLTFHYPYSSQSWTELDLDNDDKGSLLHPTRARIGVEQRHHSSTKMNETNLEWINRMYRKQRWTNLAHEWNSNRSNTNKTTSIWLYDDNFLMIGLVDQPPVSNLLGVYILCCNISYIYYENEVHNMYMYVYLFQIIWGHYLS